MTDTVPFPRRPLRKERLTSPSVASSSRTQRTPGLHVTAAIEKTKEPVRVVHNTTSTRRASKATDSDGQRGFDDLLDPHMLAGTERLHREFGMRLWIKIG